MTSGELDIRGLIDKWLAASKAGDTETLLGLLADDVLFLTPGRDPFGKEDFAKMSEGQAAASLEIDGRSEITELQILGDWAFIVNKLSVSVNKPGETPVVRSGHTLTLFKKVGGRWLLARDANLLA